MCVRAQMNYSFCLTQFIFIHIISKSIAKNPVPVRCPVAGKFNFTQRGEHPFKTRYVWELFPMRNELQIFRCVQIDQRYKCVWLVKQQVKQNFYVT